MRRTTPSRIIIGSVLIAGVLHIVAAVHGQSNSSDRHSRDRDDTREFVPNGTLFENPGGTSTTYSTTRGGIDLTGPFFQSLGTNGRSCGTCHQPSDGMSVSAAHIQERFDDTRGLDPIFRTVDGSNCNHGMNVSTETGRKRAYSLLRTRGLIRVGITVPSTADFDIERVDNQYGCDETSTISMYRRPLPSTTRS